MSQNILEARIEYKNRLLTRITVLVQMSPGDVRAIFATTKPRAGYTHIVPTDEVSEKLLQQIADYGMETVDRDLIFPGWKKVLNG